MWKTSYQAIVDVKRAERVRALSAAGTSVASVHAVFLKATGESHEFFTRGVHDGLTRVSAFFVASEIVTRIRNGEWTASDVVEAYIARAAVAQATTNCLTEGAEFFGTRFHHDHPAGSTRKTLT